jgi:hypothetical protein
MNEAGEPNAVPMKSLVIPALVALVAVLGAVSGREAAAQTKDFAGQPKIVDELKIGALGHDLGFLGHHIEGGADVNGEILFTPPDFLSIIGSPRPHLGGDVNTAGNTNDFYFGLTWGITLIQNLFGHGDGIFLNGSLGGAYQDGYENSSPPNRKKLGSAILFRESAELGYQLTPTIDISAFLEHISNANLATHNAGITSAGGRIGFKF